MSLRIGSAQGYYGDDVTRALPMIDGAHVDVVIFEALSELTMAILQKDRLADPARGYTHDIPLIANKILPLAYARGIPLITNGGGLNPLGAAEVVRSAAAAQGLRGLKIAAVTGDDVLGKLAEIMTKPSSPNPFSLMEKGNQTSLEAPRPQGVGFGVRVATNDVLTANAYLGAAPIVEALRAGAHIVITGRVADPCLYLAPMIARYGWAWDDWDRLAAGICCGHLLECTAQVVGGNSLALIDEIDAGDLARLGYPIAHVAEDGTFVLSKTPDTAGRVTIETVKEQLLYEIHDPARYLTPDVTADFTTLRLHDEGGDRVRVSGVTGHPRPDTLKVNVTQHEGWLRELIFTLGAPRAWDKVAQLKAMVAASWAGLPITRVQYDYLGMNSLYADAPLPPDPLEVVVRLTFTAAQPDTLKTAVRRLMANGLSGPAGLNVSGASIAGEPRAILGLLPMLIDRDAVQTEVTYLGVTSDEEIRRSGHR
jgi:hypothetical protein